MLADLIILGILVFCAVMGYRSGFVKTCISAASYIVSIILSFVLYPVISAFLMKTALYDFLLKAVSENIVGTGDASVGSFAGYMEDGVEIMAAGASGTIATLIINVIAFILVVIICKIIIAIIGNVLNLFTRIQVIRQINRFSGMAVGFVIGIIVIYLVLAVILACTPMLADTFLLEQIDDSILALWMYENNVLVSFVGNLIS